MEDNIILSGIVGSVAYGLDHAESDVDVIGVYQLPTREILSLGNTGRSIVSVQPDVTLHELEKYLRLGLKCNPIILDLLWLPDHLYQYKTKAGERLISMRTAFLSTKKVMDAYIGCARGFMRSYMTGITIRNITDSKLPKYAFRILEQAHQLLAYGETKVAVSNRTKYDRMDEMHASELMEEFKNEISLLDKVVENGFSKLPEEQDYSGINNFLLEERMRFV